MSGVASGAEDLATGGVSGVVGFARSPSVTSGMAALAPPAVGAGFDAATNSGPSFTTGDTEKISGVSAYTGASQADIQSFLQSSAAAGLTPDQIKALQSPLTVDGQGRIYGNGIELTSTLGQSFTPWQQKNTANLASYKSYQDMSKLQPGIQQTMLTGPTSPGILGANPSTVLGTPRQIKPVLR